MLHFITFLLIYGGFLENSARTNFFSGGHLQRFEVTLISITQLVDWCKSCIFIGYATRGLLAIAEVYHLLDDYYQKHIIGDMLQVIVIE